MQCPNCGYEPTMSEMQRNADGCIKCGASYSAPAGRNGFLAGRIKLFCMVLVAAAFGYGGVQYYEYRQAIGSLEKSIKLASAYTEQVVTSLEDSGSMTFAELFAKTSRNIEEVDSLLVRVSVLDGADTAKEQSMLYMKRAQDVMRGVSASARQMMDYSAAADRLKAAELKISSAEPGYQYSHAREARLRAVDDQIAALEELQKTRKALSDSAEEMKKAADQLRQIDQGALMRPPIFEKLNFAK